MPSIPHSFVTAVAAYAAPLVTFLIALALPFVARGKAWTAAAGPLSLFAGWALLQPVSLLPRALWAPHRGLETLLAPALACAAGMAIAAWRGRNPRLIATAMAVFAGWWIARDGVGLADFWRVWFGIAVLAVLLRQVLQGRADRLLVLGLALWGGLAVATAGPAWLLAALVAASGAAGLLLGRIAAVMPASITAALIGAVELSGGRLLHGRLDPIDIACASALAAPLVVDAVARRLPRRFSTVLAPVIGAVSAVAATWLVRRTFFT